MTEFTEAQINEAVLRDYNEVVGKVVLVTEVQCYDDNDEMGIVQCDPPAIARVSPYAEHEIASNVTNWTNDEFCDPMYNLAILEKHPAFANVRPSWTYGTCRSVKGEVDRASFTLADPELQERYKDAEGLPYETGACAPEGAESTLKPFG